VITPDVVVEAIAAGGHPKTVIVGEVACSAPVRSHGSGRSCRYPIAWDCQRNARDLLAASGYGVTRKAAGHDRMWHGTALWIGELADAVRAAANALSRLGAVTTAPDTPARRASARVAQRYGSHAA
jgi:hypothetical protein